MIDFQDFVKQIFNEQYEKTFGSTLLEKLEARD